MAIAEPINAPPPGDAWIAELLPALQRLDALLERAVATRYAQTGSGDDYAGLRVTCDDVRRLLARRPAEPLSIDPDGATDRFEPGQRLAWLEHEFELSPFDTDVLVLAVAPELDLRYEKLYAFLQDDVTRRRPTVDLALGLFCPSAQVRLLRRARFSPQAPLLRAGLVRLVPDPQAAEPPLLAHAVRADDQVVRMLLEDPSLDERLASFARICTRDDDAAEPTEPAASEIAAKLAALARTGAPLCVMFHGPDHGARRAAGHATAQQLGAQLVEANLRAALDQGDFDECLAAAFLEARLRGAVLFCEQVDALFEPGRERALTHLSDRLRDARGVIVLSAEESWSPETRVAITSIPFPVPDFQGRRESWCVALASAGVSLAAADIDALAERFALTPRGIRAAVADAVRDAAWRGVEPPAVDSLFAAARAQAGHRLSTLAAKVDSAQSWEDLVLPPDRLAQLREICDRATYRHVVYENWGFERRLALGRGLNVLFSGKPGTGKTMAASVIANELGLDLYKVDLSQVVSKYIGETEKNLREIFAEARAGAAILFFDEADALFGSRSEVRDAHDRYANIETSYLLQKMEEYDGIVVLATNLRRNIDEAFLRRLHIVVDFPFPSEADRRRIWEVTMPPQAPLGDGIDFAALARHEVPGGSIRNVAVSAAFASAVEGSAIGADELEAAVRGELRKLGRTTTEPAWEAV